MKTIAVLFGALSTLLILGIAFSSFHKSPPTPPITPAHTKTPPLAQAPAAKPATQIGAHHLGETFEEWLKITGTRLANGCQGSDQEYRINCDPLTKIQKTGSGEFQNAWTTYERRFDLGGPTTWKFHHSKLVSVTIIRYLEHSSVEDELALLQRAYGPPSTKGQVTEENGFGAVFHMFQAHWDNVPDARIWAGEGFTTYPNRALVIGLESREYEQERQEEKKVQANPYIKDYKG
jgi:hypothetical protein